MPPHLVSDQAHLGLSTNHVLDRLSLGLSTQSASAIVSFSLPHLEATMLTDDEYDYLFKLVLIGDSGVGKSNLLSRFTVK